MSVPVWPTELPQHVRVDAFGSGPRDGRLVTTVETGPPKVRRRGIGVRPLSAAIDVQLDGYARFERFWLEETRGGVLPFWMPDVVLDGVGLATDAGDGLTDEAGHPLALTAWALVQFAQAAPAYAAVGGPNFRISFTLSVLP